MVDWDPAVAHPMLVEIYGPGPFRIGRVKNLLLLLSSGSGPDCTQLVEICKGGFKISGGATKPWFVGSLFRKVFDESSHDSSNVVKFLKQYAFRRAV